MRKLLAVLLVAFSGAANAGDIDAFTSYDSVSPQSDLRFGLQYTSSDKFSLDLSRGTDWITNLPSTSVTEVGIGKQVDFGSFKLGGRASYAFGDGVVGTLREFAIEGELDRHLFGDVYGFVSVRHKENSMSSQVFINAIGQYDDRGSAGAYVPISPHCTFKVEYAHRLNGMNFNGAAASIAWRF